MRKVVLDRMVEDVVALDAMAVKSRKYYYPKKNNNLTHSGRSSE